MEAFSLVTSLLKLATKGYDEGEPARMWLEQAGTSSEYQID